MTEEMKLIIDSSTIESALQTKEKEEVIYEILGKIVENLKDEFVYSATFSLAIDTLESKSSIFEIKKGALEPPKKIYTEFKVR